MRRSNLRVNICVLDDNDITIEYVKKMSAIASQELKTESPNIFCFVSPKEFMNWLDHEEINIDVCFLDINLQSQVNGIDIAKLIKDINYHTLIVFMTSYDNYFADMVQVEPFRFLQKPFEYKNFYEIFVAVDKRIKQQILDHKCNYKYKINGITFLVDLNNIIYVSSYKRKIILCGKNGDTTEFYGKLDIVEKEIKSLTDKFIRISKSYLFNRDYIENVGKNSVSVHGINYKVSPKYKDNIKIVT